MGRIEYDLVKDLPPPTPQGEQLGWKILRWCAYLTVATALSAGLLFLLMGGNSAS